MRYLCKEYLSIFGGQAVQGYPYIFTSVSWGFLTLDSWLMAHGSWLMAHDSVLFLQRFAKAGRYKAGTRPNAINLRKL